MTRTGRRSLFILISVCALGVAGCSYVSVVSYPEAQPLEGGSLRTSEVRLAEHGFKTVWELATGVELQPAKDLWIRVTAESRKEFVVTAGPPWLPVIPAFWLWPLGPLGDETLKVRVQFRGRAFRELTIDPEQFVIVRRGAEHRPVSVSRVHGLAVPVPIFDLEYQTRNWNFAVRLGGIEGPSGALDVPDIRFSSDWIWLYGMAP